jgi:hypothetical protein
MAATNYGPSSYLVPSTGQIPRTRSRTSAAGGGSADRTLSYVDDEIPADFEAKFDDESRFPAAPLIGTCRSHCRGIRQPGEPFGRT